MVDGWQFRTEVWVSVGKELYVAEERRYLMFEIGRVVKQKEAGNEFSDNRDDHRATITSVPQLSGTPRF